MNTDELTDIKIPLNLKNVPILGQKKGLLIAFEGQDGAGKSEQVDLLRKALQMTGFKVSVFRSPGSTKIGEAIREMVKNTLNKPIPATELLLITASFAQLVHDEIIPALKEGSIVICDRYFYSTICYQAFGRQVDPNIVKAIIQFAIGDAVPDVTFMLDISEEEANKRTAKRGTIDRFEQENEDFKKRVRQGYDWLKSMEIPSKGKIVAVDASGTPEMVHTEIFRCVASRITSLQEGQLEIDLKKKIIKA